MLHPDRIKEAVRLIKQVEAHASRLQNPPRAIEADWKWRVWAETEAEAMGRYFRDLRPILEDWIRDTEQGELIFGRVAQTDTRAGGVFESNSGKQGKG